MLTQLTSETQPLLHLILPQTYQARQLRHLHHLPPLVRDVEPLTGDQQPLIPLPQETTSVEILHALIEDNNLTESRDIVKEGAVTDREIEKEETVRDASLKKEGDMKVIMTVEIARTYKIKIRGTDNGVEARVSLESYNIFKMLKCVNCV